MTGPVITLLAVTGLLVGLWAVGRREQADASFIDHTDDALRLVNDEPRAEFVTEIKTGPVIDRLAVQRQLRTYRGIR